MLTQLETDKSRNNPIGKTAVDVLKTIEEDGAKHKLEDKFISKKAILYESDKSYLESKRILMHLKEETDAFKRNGCWHATILIGIILMILSLTIVSAWFYFYEIEEIDSRNTTRVEKCAEENEEFVRYSYILQAVLFFLLGLTSVGGLGFLIFQVHCMKKRLYKAFGRGLCIIYIVIMAITLALVIIQQITVNNIIDIGDEKAVGKDGTSIECKWSRVASDLCLVLLSLCLSVVGLSVFYILVFVVVFFKRRRDKKGWGGTPSLFDFFFCDDICGFYRIVHPKPKTERDL